MRLSARYRDLPVKIKLRLIILATVALALTVSSCAALTYLHSVLRSAMKNDLAVLAEMYGVNSTAALTFGDQAAATELLTGFRAKRSIISAALYTQSGTVFVTYHRPNSVESTLPEVHEEGASLFQGRIRVFRRILLEGQPIGTIYLESDLNDVNEKLKAASLALLLILCGAFAVAFLLAARLQSAISEPIRRLAEVARQVSTNRDYSTRAEKLSNDDLGQLTLSFNNMLTEIENRDAQLLATQGRLEQNVVERTAELAQARDRAEETCVLLDQSRERLSLALDGASEALWDYDIANHDTYYSDRTAEMLGYTPDEIGDSLSCWADLIHPDDRPGTAKALRAHMDGQTEAYEAEYRVKTKQGDWRWMQARGKVVERTADGTPTRVTGTHLDITEHKRAEQALARQHYILDNLIESVPDQIYFKDRESRFIRVNRALLKRFNRQEPGEVLGKTDCDFFTADHAGPARADEQELLEGRQTMVCKDERETWPDGSETWVQTTKMPLRDDSGTVIGTFGISRDMTGRKRMEEDLRTAKDVAEAGSRAKSEFLANMSHEIRTPMNGIIGMTELALDTVLTEEQRDYLVTVRSSGESLLTIINDILDFSKIEAGKLLLDAVEFDLDALLHETVRTVALSAHQKGLELIYENRMASSARVVGDPGRIRQIVINLLGNAVKFTASGEVSLQVGEFSHDGHSVTVQISVSDTGVGVSPEWRERIFDAFVQADGSNTRRYGGTGLGLAICSRLVALMGGRIWLDTETAKGSSFHFTVPLGATTAIPETSLPTEPAALRGLRVLVVDDNATNRRILQEHLNGWCMSPVLADCGEQALAILHAGAEAKERFDLVLLDAHMPGMDGFALARRIASNAHLSGPRIMMLSSVDGKAAGGELIPLGIREYVIKPVTRATLLKVVLKVMVLNQVLPTIPQAVLEGHPIAALRVLLAEDNLVNQRVASLLLKREGHSVVTVSNGREAVEALAREAFDVILMDVQMPVMNGYEATREIRSQEDPRGRRVPIVALTAHAMKGDREICLEAGMDDYLSKPIKSGELRAVLAKWTPSPEPCADSTGPISLRCCLQ